MRLNSFSIPNPVATPVYFGVKTRSNAYSDNWAVALSDSDVKVGLTPKPASVPIQITNYSKTKETLQKLLGEKIHDQGSTTPFGTLRNGTPIINEFIALAEIIRELLGKPEHTSSEEDVLALAVFILQNQGEGSLAGTPEVEKGFVIGGYPYTVFRPPGFKIFPPMDQSDSKSLQQFEFAGIDWKRIEALFVRANHLQQRRRNSATTKDYKWTFPDLHELTSMLLHEMAMQIKYINIKIMQVNETLSRGIKSADDTANAAEAAIQMRRIRDRNIFQQMVMKADPTLTPSHFENDY